MAMGFIDRLHPISGHDFTWEREWRIKATSLELEPQHTTVFVKNKSDVEILLKEHYEPQDFAIRLLSEHAAPYGINLYPWSLISLEEIS